MDKFTREIFRRDGFDEIDESWRGGAYIGGLIGREGDAGIATSYRRASDMLVERAIRDDEVCAVVMPVLFLYRHAVELMLKTLLQSPPLTHDLGVLLEELERRLVAKCGYGLSDELKARIRELGQIDPRADAFRFQARKPTKNKREPHFTDEVWADVAYLREVVAWIERELGCLACIGPTT